MTAHRWDQMVDPQLKWLFITVLIGNQTVDTSGWVINLNMKASYHNIPNTFGTKNGAEPSIAILLGLSFPIKEYQWLQCYYLIFVQTM